MSDSGPIAYIPRTYETQAEAQSYVDSVNPKSDVTWIVVDGSKLPFGKGTEWIMNNWIAWPNVEEED